MVQGSWDLGAPAASPGPYYPDDEILEYLEVPVCFRGAVGRLLTMTVNGYARRGVTRADLVDPYTAVVHRNHAGRVRHCLLNQTIDLIKPIDSIQTLESTQYLTIGLVVV